MLPFLLSMYVQFKMYQGSIDIDHKKQLKVPPYIIMLRGRTGKKSNSTSYNENGSVQYCLQTQSLSCYELLLDYSVQLLLSVQHCTVVLALSTLACMDIGHSWLCLENYSATSPGKRPVQQYNAEIDVIIPLVNTLQNNYKSAINQTLKFNS